MLFLVHLKLSIYCLNCTIDFTIKSLKSILLKMNRTAHALINVT